MRFFLGIGWFFFAMILVNCGGFVKSPDWVNHPSARFPQTAYLVGVGESDSRSGAETAALAVLARIFHVRIEQKTEEWQQYLQVESKGRSRVEQNQSIAVLTKASTDRVLEGAEIVEVAQEKSRYYALAVINRQQATNRLTEQIQQLDEEVRKTLDLAQEGSTKLIRIRNYKDTIKRLMLREAYNTDLAIVNLLGEGVPPLISTREVVQVFSTWLAKNFLVDVQISGSESAVIKKAITEALLQEEFPVAATTEGADLWVTGAVDIVPVSLAGQPFQYVRWCVDLTVYEAEQNRIVGVAALSGREGHLSATEAAARAVKSLLPKVTEATRGIIASYFSDEFKAIKNGPSSCVKGN